MGAPRDLDNARDRDEVREEAGRDDHVVDQGGPLSVGAGPVDVRGRHNGGLDRVQPPRSLKGFFRGVEIAGADKRDIAETNSRGNFREDREIEAAPVVGGNKGDVKTLQADLDEHRLFEGANDPRPVAKRPFEVRVIDALPDARNGPPVCAIFAPIREVGR